MDTYSVRPYFSRIDALGAGAGVGVGDCEDVACAARLSIKK